MKKSFDHTRYKQKFTPRRTDSIWSASNKKRVETLIEQGLMTVSCLEIVKRAKISGSWNRMSSSALVKKPPEEFLEALDTNIQARSFFESLDPPFKNSSIRGSVLLNASKHG